MDSKDWLLAEGFPEIIKLILPAIKHGAELSLGITEDGSPMVNLNTGAKSHCHLTMGQDGVIIAKMRYGKEEKVESWQDVCFAVSSCRLGRPYFSLDWSELLEKEGIQLN